MTRVLIVDDQEDYREELEFALDRRGFDVVTAASGREAIDIGAWFRPDVLVADWVLVDQIHGLQVAETLRLLTPDLPLVLMSGFASEDLEFDARQVEVFRLLEKPFGLECMIEAVGEAARSQHSTLRSKPVGVLEIDSLGEIRYASPLACKWLTETRGGMAARNIHQILTARDAAKLARAEQNWVDVKPRIAPRASQRQPLHWQVRSRPLAKSDRTLLVIHRGCLRLLDDCGSHYSSEFLVRLLLDCPMSYQPRWPLAGRALVIDSSELFRRLAAAEIERAAGFCHSADSYGSSLEILRGDPEIAVIIIDDRVIRGGGRDLVENLRTLNPNALIAVQSSHPQGRHLAERGIEHFLHKPWHIEDLLGLLDPSTGASFGPRPSLSPALGRRYPSLTPVC